MKKAFFILLLLSDAAFAQERKISLLQTVTEIPQTTLSTLEVSFSKESLPYWGAVLSSTALLYHYDEQLLDGAQDDGRKFGIGNEDNTKAFIRAGGQDLLRLPTDMGSFLYFLGDGWMHGGIAAGFLAAGHFGDNNYHWNTGAMIFHGMFVSTILNQTLKRSFGRESPFVKTKERGAWKMFPSFNEYNTNTARYDAMPSGHVMTTALTFTILGERYPKHSTAIYSTGAVWAGALMWQMMNNGVHWASDYPLGIAMGIVTGKMATKLAQRKEKANEFSQWIIYPAPSGLFGLKTF